MAHFEKVNMNYIIKKYNAYCESEILPLYESVGWTNYTSNPRMLERAYNNSLCTFAAYVDGNVVGIVRAVGDGASLVFVQDLLVSPQYQRPVKSRPRRAENARFPLQ